MFRHPISSESRAEADEMERRERFQLDCVFDNEPIDSFLRPLLGCWMSQSGGRHPPSEHEFICSTLMRPEVAQRLTIIHVDYDAPENFLVLQHCPSPIESLGRKLGQTRLSSFPSRLVGTSLKYAYEAVKNERAPRYEWLDQIIAGRYSRQYTRLLLPLADETRKIVSVLSATRAIHPSHELTPRASRRSG